MPNSITYNVSTQSLALKKGNFYIGTGDVGKGPTSTTGYFDGVSPVSGGYVIYVRNSAGKNLIYGASNDSQLILITNRIAGASYTTVDECLVYFAGQTDKMVLNRNYESIVTSGLVLNLDAGFTPSYPRSNTTWYDTSLSGNNGTLTNGPTYSSDNGGSIVFDGINDYVNISGNATNDFQPTNSFTINAIFKPTGIGSPTAVIDNTSVVLGAGVTAGSYGIGLNYNQIAGTYNLRIGCRSTDNIFLTADYPITLNTIYDVSLTYQTNGIQYIYVNGVQINSQSTVAFSSKSLTPSTTWGFNIFRNYPVYGGNGRYGIGYFYKGLIYNRALSQAEILQNYNAQKGRFGL